MRTPVGAHVALRPGQTELTVMFQWLPRLVPQLPKFPLCPLCSLEGGPENANENVKKSPIIVTQDNREII